VFSRRFGFSLRLTDWPYESWWGVASLDPPDDFLGEYKGVRIIYLLLKIVLTPFRSPPKKSELRDVAKPSASPLPSRTDFDAVIGLIEAARSKAIAAVNTTLIDLYWSIGEHIGQKNAQDGWGKGTVESLPKPSSGDTPA
jgi:hypothetical protein